MRYVGISEQTVTFAF